MITRSWRVRRPASPLRSGRSMFWRRPARVALVAMIAMVSFFVSPSGIASAGGYTTIEGAGSSWAAIAINQWIFDAKQFGLTVNYNPDGSAEGRQQYEQGGEVDFAGSDPPFRDGNDKLAGTSTELPVPWAYSYIPDTAGGTAFMYHLTVGGHQVRNLRLSGQVLMEIFTGQITNWDNPQITHIYGGQLPNEPIVPVLRADGSGATYFFTLWMQTEFPTDWDKFCEKVHPGITLPCGPTEFFPQFGDAKLENGSISVANYITASYGEGTIGYDEYAYALSSHYPVVQLLNKANYFVGPTASNVAIALQKAGINEDRSSPSFLQQSLGSVYTDTDPRAYPLSSYSYLIVPRLGGKSPPFFNTAAGASLSKFTDYFLCQGQSQIAPLGYSPLPFNLVEGAFIQVNQIPGHVSTPNIGHYASCGNPTFKNGHDILTADAPYPSKCQKLGAPLNCKVVGGKAVSSTSGPGSSGSHGSGSGKAGGGGSNGNPAAGGGPGSTTGTSGPGAANVTGTVVSLGGSGTDRALLGGLTAVAIILAVALPPTLGVWLRRRKRQARA